MPEVRFISARVRAQWAVVLLLAVAVLDVVSIISTFIEIDLLTQVDSGVAVSEADLAASDVRQQLMGVYYALAVTATAVCFLMWLSREYRNLWALSPRKPKFAPGWAVGAWFVPFLNLVRPVQIVKELWVSFDPDYVPDASASQDKVATPALVGWWWAVFLLSTFVDWAFASSLDAETIPEFLSRSYLLVASDTVEIVEVILAVNVVRGVNARLEDQASHPHQSAQQ